MYKKEGQQNKKSIFESISEMDKCLVIIIKKLKTGHE